MKNLLHALLMGMVWSLAAVQLKAQAAAPELARVIVKLRKDSALLGPEVPLMRAMHDLGNRTGLALQDGPPIAPLMRVALLPGMSSADLASRLSKESDIEYAVADERRSAPSATPNDPLYLSTLPNSYVYSGQWYLGAPTQSVVAAINGPQSWAYTTGSADVVVAVIDTGIRKDHEDLSGKLLAGYNMISDPIRAGNDTGRSADPSDLGDWLTDSEISQHPSTYSGCPTRSKSSWHGTQVASLIGAQTNNQAGMAALGWNVRILPVRVLGKCGGYDSDIMAAMRWAVGLEVPGVSTVAPAKARVLNLSLGGSATCSRAYKDAISDVSATGALIVAAAGNDRGHAVSTPANCPGVLAVGALAHTGVKASYSSLGPEVALSAPGGNCSSGSPYCDYPMLVATNSGSTTPVDAPDGTTYTGNLGTSFSAPLVSASAALVWSLRSDLSASDVKKVLIGNVRAFPASSTSNGASTNTNTCTAPNSSDQGECACTTSTCGAGMLDAGAAVSAASSFVPDTADSTDTEGADTASAANSSGGGGALGESDLLVLAIYVAGLIAYRIVVELRHGSTRSSRTLAGRQGD